MKLLPIAVACAVTAAGLWAQSASVSQISGTIEDPTGSAVPGAQIKAVQTATGLTRAAASGPDGSYVLPSLPTGPYRLEVSKQGFSTYVQSGIVLQVDTNPSIDVILRVGEVTQQVVVEASAAMVETHSTGVGQVVDQQRVVDLPLNGRYATDLIFLAGAAAPAPNADLVSTKNYPNEAPLSIAGGLATGTTYLLDGGTHNDPFNNLNLPLPFPDALQEFKVETSALPAQYGQHSGGAVNAITKSGSNEFHGDLFEFVRNYKFNARNFFALERDSLRRNQFGGTLGGPIKKDKLFFFLGYQGTTIRSSPTQSFGFVPTPDMLKGDFSTVTSTACQARPVKLKDPSDPSGKTFFNNNQVPITMFSPAALKMLTYYPTPVDSCGKTFYSTVQNQDEHQGIARGDYQVTSKQSVYLRYYVSHSLQPTTYDGKNPLSMTFSGADDLVNSGVFGHTYVITPNVLNALHATFNRSAVAKTQVPLFDGPSLGIKMTTLVPGHFVPSVTGAIGGPSVFSYAAFDPTTDYQLSDDLSVVKGSHQLAFGVNWIHSIQNVYGPLFGDGSFRFTGQITGLSMADFLLGKASSFTQGGIQYDYERYQYFGAYAQDSWKVTPNLTVNYGLRWEPYIGGSMSTGYVSHFDPALFAANVHSSVYPNAPAGVLFPGDAGFDTNSRPSHTKMNDFAPRLGIVWDPKGDGRMTVRASWGIFYDMPHTLFAYGFSEEPPWGESIGLQSVSFDDPWADFPGGNPFPIHLDKNFTFPIPGNYTTYPLDIRPTYLEQWNLSLQKQIGKDWLASASYLGNNTIHLWADAPINAAVYIPGVSTLATENRHRVLYLQNPEQGQYFGTIHQLAPDSTASYNALLLSLQHRLANHFTVLGNYTWSHCIADPFTSELDGVQYTNPADRRYDRGNCAGIDHRHLVNISAVEDAPRFSGRVMQAVAGDWKLSEIIRIQSGSYFSVSSGQDLALNGIGGQRASFTGSSPYAASSTCANSKASCVAWLNPAAFAQPATGTFGNLGANNILGPGAFQFDASLVRQVPIREQQRLELRAEAFNLLNHFRPNNPAATLSTLSTFGQITTSGDPRIMQFALKYVF
ncbi:MAG TPA: TonB-dependent receptor [Bryobacteraceae bacterium]|nr:TonB-dependent receptor [Bryobacteraceae bacterium]